tara:strand:- start:1303 stop:1716 length:414 start_codon:yes stop_codon:yes gene_type:complete
MKGSIYILVIIFSISLNIKSQDNYFLSENNKILPADEVFKINILNTEDTIVVEWNIKDKYYLYSDSIKINQNNKPVKYMMLKSKKYKIEDEFFGKTEIFKDFLSISINNIPNESGYVILYQGCAEAGFCYPIQEYVL